MKYKTIVRGGSMKREEFERQLQQLVPRLDGKTTEAWYRYGLEMCGEFSYDFLEAMMMSFGFLKNNFLPETVKDVYGAIPAAHFCPPRWQPPPFTCKTAAQQRR